MIRLHLNWAALLAFASFWSFSFFGALTGQNGFFTIGQMTITAILLLIFVVFVGLAAKKNRFFSETVTFSSKNLKAWGLYHAALVYLYRVIKPLGNLEKKFPVAAWGTMLCLSMASWIPFRARDLKQTLDLFSILFSPSRYRIGMRALQFHSHTIVPVLVLGMVLLWFTIKTIESAQRKNQIPAWVETFFTTFAVCFATVLALIYLKPVQQFIYFQF